MTFENNTAKALGLEKIGFAGLVIGVVCLGITFATGLESAMPSYLFGYMFWFSMTVGCIGLILLHHTVRGAWGLSILRLIESGGSVMSLLFLAVLALPIFMNLSKLYGWTSPDFKSHPSEFTNFKFAWMSEGPFIARILVYFLIWGVYVYFLRKSSLQQDETLDNGLAQRRTNASAPGIVVFVIAATLAFTDLTMSIDPHWFSQIWGFINIAGSTLAVFAFCNLIVMSNARKAPYSEVMNRGLSKDLGNWMFVFTCLWAYFSFSQYVIIYAGNLPEFNSFFIDRQDPSWGAIGLALMFGSFLVPFVWLLFPRVKATPAWLVRVAVWILIFRVVDLYWMIVPHYREAAIFDYRDLTALLGVGGFWLFAFGKQVEKGRLLPTHDPRLVEAYEHA